MRARNAALFFIGILFFAFPLVLIPRTAFADGQFYSINSVGGQCIEIGTWDPDTWTCTLTGDVDGDIEIDDALITLDGAGHTLTVDPPGGTNEPGIDVWQANSVTIKNLTIRNGGTAIYFEDSDSGSAINNTIISANIGINFFRANGGEASGNHIYKDSEGYGWDGVVSSYSGGLTIHDNTISGVQYGVSISSNAGSNIIHNAIDDTGTGIYLDSVQNIDVSSNQISHATGSAFYLKAKDAVQDTIHGNVFSDSAVGVTVFYPRAIYATFDWSPIHSLTRALAWLVAPRTAYADTGDGAVFFGNSFLNDDTPAVVNPQASVRFFNPLPEGGNTWDVYDEPSEGCTDADHDGFCDSPYVIDAVNNIVDQYPRVQSSQVDPCAIPGSCVSNVLFLPGIEGSRLYEGTGCGKTPEEKLWEPFDSIHWKCSVRCGRR